MSTTEMTHLALPTQDELDETVRAVGDALERLGSLYWGLAQFYRLQPLPQEAPGEMVGASLYPEGGPTSLSTYEPPTFEAIGRVHVAVDTLRTYMNEANGYMDMEDELGWLGVLEGTSGKIKLEEEAA